ncbi:MAG TPA: 1,2-phenylacetyl-CoA epoxidase subunit PaaC [Puia sp.]|nr:1,2-phenylacetyl-CoA epoxidase subunit PaaC [Puia sp.]HVZ98011.1 1,2-phenylacetyl-CoA epoxidase subunit PaaC [Chitinophagaceae bacterium]
MDQNLLDYTLHLADNALIMGHRLSEWTGHGPTIEQDIAITNIALDLIGQSRNFYQYAALLTGKETEDTLAYLRDSRAFKNLLIAEIPNGDWATTITKLFFFSTYHFYLYQQMISSADTQLAAIAEKSLKEVTYHVRWSGDWVIRLGDGTEESRARMEKAVENTWSLTGEMFEPAVYEKSLAENRIGVDVSKLRKAWLKNAGTVFEEATLVTPDDKIWMQSGGKTGIHSEALGYILAEMQYLQRAYPGCEW